MTAIAELSRILNHKAKETIQVSTIWATVKSVDWESKTCVCIGDLDNLEYYDVLLGIGSIHVRPEKGTLVLLGIINGNSAATFLISASHIQEIEALTKTSKLIIKDDGFTIKKDNESLRDILNDMIDELNKIIVIQGTTINVAAMNVIKTRVNNLLVE